MTTNIEFVIGVAGERYQRLASVLLQSIYEVYGRHAVAIVVHQDVEDVWLRKVLGLLPLSKTVQLQPPLRPEYPCDMIPLNLRLWRTGAARCTGTRVAFMDADMMLVKPIDQYFGHSEITYTYKTYEAENLKWMINAGIVLTSFSDLDNFRHRTFMAEWLRRVEAIIPNRGQVDLACKEWGSVDQAVLGRWLDTEDYSDIVSRGGYTMRGVPCSELNEATCVPVVGPACVIHYKGSWHPVLLDGKRSDTRRPMSICDEQRQLWEETAARWDKA